MSASSRGGGLNIPRIMEAPQSSGSAVGNLSAPQMSSGSATGNPRNKVALKPGHSLMDWVRLGNSGVDLTGVGGVTQEVTLSQLAAHNKKNDAWLAIRGKVYNVTRYMDFHPGGDEELMRGVGKDATELFNQVHAWVNYESLLHKCYVGRLVYSDANLSPPIISKASSLIERLFVKKDKCITMDWYQQLGSVSLQFFTRGGVPQTHVTLDGKELVVDIRLGDITRVTHVDLEHSVSWPCKVNTNYETGKVEVVLNKQESVMWRSLGQQSIEDCNQKQDTTFYPMQVVNMSEVTHNTKLIVLQHKKCITDTVPIGFSVQVQVKINGEEVVRSYTPIVAALHDDKLPAKWREDCICLMVKEYSAGLMGRHICNLKPSDTLTVSRPVGCLSSLVMNTHLVLLAAGTGFTPMVQVIKWGLSRKKLLKIHLMFFNVSTKDILWREQLDRLADSDSRFSVTYVLSAPDKDWTGKRGRLNSELLQEAVSANQKKNDNFVFVCGPMAFNQCAINLLKEMGFKEDQYYIFQG